MKIYSSAEMTEIERLAVCEFGIPAGRLMENAGRGLAAVALQQLGSGRIALLCGPGNNGGDGLAAARFLNEAGVSLEVLLFCAAETLKPDSKIHYDLLVDTRVQVRHVQGARAAEICLSAAAECGGIIDALFGMGVNRPLQAPWRDLVEIMNESGKKIISADLPSGLNADTGEIMGICARAAATAVFGGLKKGLTHGAGPKFAGDIHLIDIGLPSVLLNS